MPKPSTTLKPKPAPMPMAAETDNEMPMLQRPSVVAAPKPTLWQRIWYGANAERKLAAQQVPLADSLSEVKAGVLAEMQSMARTRGGVSGSPFATVMLPVQAKAAPATAAPKPTKRRRWGWWVAPLAVLGFAWLLFQVVAWRTLPVAPVAPMLPAPELLPFPSGPSLADKPQAPEVSPKPTPAPATVDLLAKPTTLLGREALVEVVRIGALSSTPVANRPEQMVLNATVSNQSAEPLQQLQLELRVDDQAGVPLLRRVLTVPQLGAKQTSTQRFVLDLLPAQPERLVATVPLRALRASLVPLKAELGN